MNVNGRVALVTGASQGIGRAIAIELARGGAAVVLAARDREKLSEVEKLIQEFGGTAWSVDMDITSPDSVLAAMEATVKLAGKVEVLVNNAGITRDGLALRLRPHDWDAVLQTNLTAAFSVTQACLPAMMKNRWGRIIYVTSVVGQAGHAGQSNYAASKAGLLGLAKSLASEVATRNITVNAVSPGYIETAMTAKLKEEQKQANLAHVPLGRVGTPEDVAYGVRFLASAEASYITGQTLDINGGMYMR